MVLLLPRGATGQLLIAQGLDHHLREATKAEGQGGDEGEDQKELLAVGVLKLSRKQAKRC